MSYMTMMSSGKSVRRAAVDDQDDQEKENEEWDRNGQRYQEPFLRAALPF